MTSQIMVFTKQTATVMDIKTAIKNCKRAGNFRFAEGLEAAAKAAKESKSIVSGFYNNCAFIVNSCSDDAKQIYVALLQTDGDFESFPTIHLQHMLRVRPREVLLDVLKLVGSDNEHAMLSYEYELDAKCSMVLDKIHEGEIRE